MTLMLHGSNEEGREVILLNQLVCPTNLEREREGGGREDSVLCECRITAML